MKEIQWIKWQPELPHARVTVELGVFSVGFGSAGPVGRVRTVREGPSGSCAPEHPQSRHLSTAPAGGWALHGVTCPQNLLAQLLTAWGWPCVAFEGDAIVTTKVIR